MSGTRSIVASSLSQDLPADDFSNAFAHAVLLLHKLRGGGIRPRHGLLGRWLLRFVRVTVVLPHSLRGCHALLGRFDRMTEVHQGVPRRLRP